MSATQNDELTPEQLATVQPLPGLTETETVVLRQMRRAQHESIWVRSQDSARMGTVYLDNVPASGNKAFAGILASLTKKGYYEPEADPDYSGIFGNVKLND